MTHQQLSLILLKDAFAICRLDPGSAIPDWAERGEFSSVTRTAEELSIVCAESAVPCGVEREAGWRCLRVAGPLDFSMVGVLASIVSPLAESGISIFCVSTFDTDHLLVKEADLEKAIGALEGCGHRTDGK